MRDLQRGTWMFFGESIFHIPMILFIILPNLYCEIQKSKSRDLVNIKSFYLKSIPFLVFSSMLFASIFRLFSGVAAYFADPNQQYKDPTTFGLYINSIQFMTFEYYFIELLWIKLATVFYSKDNDLPLSRIKIIDRIVYCNIIFSLIFHAAYAILQRVLYDPFGNRVWWDSIWRIYFLVFVAIIALSLGHFGIQILIHLTKKYTIDSMLKKKIQAVLVLTVFMGTSVWVINVFYLVYHDDRRDWINLGIYSLEIINIIWVSIILGRGYIWIRIRCFLGFPEIIEEKSSHNVSNEISLKKTNNSLESSNIDISVDRVDENSSKVIV